MQGDCFALQRIRSLSRRPPASKFYAPAFSFKIVYITLLFYFTLVITVGATPFRSLYWFLHRFETVFKHQRSNCAQVLVQSLLHAGADQYAPVASAAIEDGRADYRPELTRPISLGVHLRLVHTRYIQFGLKLDASEGAVIIEIVGGQIQKLSKAAVLHTPL